MRYHDKRLLQALGKRLRDSSSDDELWSVLTALRGPDIQDENEDLKMATTCIIRRVVLGPPGEKVSVYKGYKASYYFGAGGMVAIKDSKILAGIRASAWVETGYSHFLSHAQGAFCALGLKWEKVNKL